MCVTVNGALNNNIMSLYVSVTWVGDTESNY